MRKLLAVGLAFASLTASVSVAGAQPAMAAQTEVRPGTLTFVQGRPPPWAACRREDLLGLLAMLDEQVGELDVAVAKAAEENPQARLLMTQPGVGPNTALAFVLTIGEVSRFQRGKQVASYLGLIPHENSSGDRRRTGAISKQGNRMLRSLLVEAAQVAVRCDPGMRKQYLHRCHQKAKGVAKVAAARKLGIRLWILLRDQIDYQEFCRRGQLRQKHGGAHAGMPA